MPLNPLLMLTSAAALLGSLWFAAPAGAAAEEKTVEYQLPDGTPAKGYLVMPEKPADNSADAKSPAVLVIPEWWGLTEYPKMRARELAAHGYVAFVADMYGNGQTTDSPDKAKELSGKAHKEGLAKLAAPALAKLKSVPGVDGSKVAAIGFCFGGSTVADLVKTGADIQAAASFHGGLGPDLAAAAGSNPKTPFLVCHGGADPMVKPAQFGQFVQKEIEAGVPLTVVSFPGVKHAFTNPKADSYHMDGIKYDEAAAKTSFKIMYDFFDMTLKPAGGRAAEMNK